MRSVRAILAVFLPSIGVVARISLAQLGAPELLDLQQLGCQAGQVLPPMAGAVGQELVGTSAHFPFEISANEPIPADTKPGIYQIRAQGQNGLSNSRSFMVTMEPWKLISANESEVNPASVAPGTIWQDECPERGRNYYRLNLDQDQRLQLETYAYALDSRARLVVSVLNVDRATIATCSATNDRDALLSFDLKANTDYTLVINDHLFRGGVDYRYALKLNPSPSRESDQINIIEQWRQISQSLHNGSMQPPKFTTCWLPRCAMLRAPSNADVKVHEEGVHSGSQSMLVTWPTILAGEFNSNDDIDIIDFECEAKTDVAVEMISQRLGEQTDGFITTFRVENLGQPNEILHRIVDNDDGLAIGNGEMRFAIKDPMFAFQAPEKGMYRLHVRSQQRLDRSAPTPKYAMEIRKPKPGFVLGAHLANPTRDIDQARITSPTIGAGGSVMVSVHALRFDNFAEPIELNMVGLPAGFRGGSGVIARDQSLSTLNVWNFGPSPAPEKVEIKRVEIRGAVEIGEQSIAVTATPLEVIWNAIDTFRSPIAKVSHQFNLVKAEAVVCPLTIELGPKNLDAGSPIRIDGTRGQSLKIPIRVTRRPGGEGAITVRLHHSPPKTSAAEVKIEPNASDAILDLQIPKDTPIGEFMLGTLSESVVSVPNTDPLAKEKTKSYTLQLPGSSLRIRIGDAP